MNDESPITGTEPPRGPTWREWAAVAWVAVVVLIFLRQVLAAWGVFYSP